MSFRGPGLVQVKDRREEGREGEAGGRAVLICPKALGSVTGYFQESVLLTLCPTGSPPVNTMSSLHSMKGTRFLPAARPSLVWRTDTLMFIHSTDVFFLFVFCFFGFLAVPVGS